MNNKQAKIFKEALQEANTGDIDMGVADWAMSVGLMHSYGHGNDWETFTKSEAVARIEEYVDEILALNNQVEE